MLVCTYFLFLPVGLYVLSPWNILAFLSVPLKLLPKFSFIWITPTWATWLHMISLSILIRSLKKIPLLSFRKYLLSTYHFLMSRLGFFSPWGLASKRPAFLPSRPTPVSLLVLQGQAVSPWSGSFSRVPLAPGVLWLMSTYHFHCLLGC